MDGLIRDGVRVQFKDETGRNRQERVRLIDFEQPANNHFLAVTQLWVQSTGAAAKAGYRRPDILLYVNGLPLVFIELKNSNVKLRCAYDDNLTNYKADIPQLFLTNVFCAFSNGIETRIGSLSGEWEHFFHWLRPEDEKEKIRREQIRERGHQRPRYSGSGVTAHRGRAPCRPIGTSPVCVEQISIGDRSARAGAQPTTTALFRFRPISICC